MASAQHSTRPLAVTIIVVFMLIQMVVAAVTWLETLAELGITSLDDLSTLNQLVVTPENVVALLTAVSLPLLEIFALVVIVGLLRMKWWALTCAMLLEGLILTLGLLGFLRGDVVPARAFIGVINVILLNQLPVRRAFGEKVGSHD